MAAFFIPGVPDDDRGLGLEQAYRDMRARIELDMGQRPRARRIVSLWTRRGGVDCVTEVGVRDPVDGGTVMAIFDMGPHQPFVIWRESDSEPRDGVREVLGPNAYSVLEFDA